MAAKMRILVVDDERNIVEVLAVLLSRQGYEVEMALSGEEAMELIRSTPFDLMLTDVRMGEMDGLTLLKKSLKFQPGLSVVVMTAYSTVDTAITAMNNGAFDYICKPFKMEDFWEVFNRAIRQKRLSGQASAQRCAGDRGLSAKAFVQAKERSNIRYVLQKCDNDREQAARELGISTASLERKWALEA
jgi:DNA-binding NtrC family response regulator